MKTIKKKLFAALNFFFEIGHLAKAIWQDLTHKKNK